MPRTISNDNQRARNTYFFSDSREPHQSRTREIFEKHPEIRNLFGNDPLTALWAIAIVALLFVLAICLQEAPAWAVLLVAWTLGAVLQHALFVIVHDCAHNLAFRGSFGNKTLSVVANLPGIIPSAIAFRNYHLLHHRYQGEVNWDPDLAGPKESLWVGNSAVRKMLWLFCQPLVLGILRPLRIKKVFLLEPWAIFNGVCSLGSAFAVYYFFGGASASFIALSVLAATGLHPLGARWIQEHYTFNPDQETFSYYGPMNKLAFNVGYHYEHHDFMMVPWSKLPDIRRLAPEYYDSLECHESWSKLFLRFIFDQNFTLFNRVVRPDHENTPKCQMTTKDTQAITDQARKQVRI